MHMMLSALSQMKTKLLTMIFAIALMPFSQAIAEEPSSASPPPGRVQEATAQDRSPHDWERVATTASRVLETSPKNSDGYVIRARVFHLCHKPVSAITDLKKALALKPEHSPAWELMSETYFQLGQYEDALVCLRQALRYATDAPQREKLEACQRSTENLVSRGRTMDFSSVSLFQKWVRGPELALDPVGASVKSDDANSSGNSAPQQETSSTVKEAKKAAEMANYELAAALYKEQLKKAPYDAQCHYDLAVIYEITKKIPQAAEHYKRAIDLKPDHIEAMLALGDLNAITLNDGKEALYWYALAIKSEVDPSRKKLIADRMKRFLICR